MISSEFKTARELSMTEEILELQKRNAIRLQEAKEKMGSRYLLHPANKVVKMQVSAPVLQNYNFLSASA